MWIGANGGFERRYQKKRQILSFPSGFSVVLLWAIGENVSCARTGEKKNARVVEIKNALKLLGEFRISKCEK